MTTSPRNIELLSRARQELGVPQTTEVADVVALLETWGATPMPVGSFEANLFDEYVDEALVVYQASINDERLIAEHLTQDERAGFFPDDEPDDPDDEPVDSIGVDDRRDGGWGAVFDELDTARRVIVILERDRHAPQQVGNFRVHGAGQWIREALWAATGTMPRDPGSAGSTLYAQAIDVARPERPDLPVAAYDRLPGWLWNTYVTLMRPLWRHARRRYVGVGVGG